MLSREFVHRTAQSLLCGLYVSVAGADVDDLLPDVDPRCTAVRLTETVPHSHLKTIGTCTGQHFVDSEDVDRLRADAEVEEVLSDVLNHIFVRGDTRGFERLRAEVFLLARNEIYARREGLNVCLAVAEVVDGDLADRACAAEAGLQVRLLCEVPVAAGGATTHGRKKV